MAEIPEDVLVNQSDFFDPENDHVAVSRLGNLVDLSGAIAFGGQILGQRRVNDPLRAGEVWDSEKDDLGNAGIRAKDVLNDSERW